MYPIQKRLLTILGLCVAGAACDGPSSSPTEPSSIAQTGTSTESPSLSASSGRGQELHLTKDCTGTWAGQAGGFCTITASNLKEIKRGSTVVYQQPAGATSLDSDVILYPPSSGNQIASGHCALNFLTNRGQCTFSGDRGKLKGFQANVDVACVGLICTLDGTYSFRRRD